MGLASSYYYVNDKATYKIDPLSIMPSEPSEGSLPFRAYDDSFKPVDKWIIKNLKFDSIIYIKGCYILKTKDTDYYYLDAPRQINANQLYTVSYITLNAINIVRYMTGCARDTSIQ